MGSDIRLANGIFSSRTGFPGAEYHCAYEAGFSGFWPQHALEREGIATLVAHPPDIPTSDKERRFKRNKVDERKVARQLRAGELKDLHCCRIMLRRAR